MRVVRDAAGRPQYLSGVMVDVGERKQLEAQLLQSQKMEAIGRLAGGVAHDFNNLLTVILGHTSLLRRRPALEGSMRRALDLIEQTAERASALTRQLLAFSRRQMLQPEIIDLNAVVRGMEPMLRLLIGEDITLALELALDLGAVRADPGQIEQVVMNLVVNARDAMPAGGLLVIATQNRHVSAPTPGLAPGRFVTLSVTDTGSGMDRETQAHIFEPFFTTKEAGKGTGLGLATVYGIVTQSGGQIDVVSQVGQGTRFTIYLPSLADDAAALLRRLKIPRAHVVGASIGGTIAQELALRPPRLVRSLSLACTWANADGRFLHTIQSWISLASRVPVEECYRHVLYPWLFTPAFLADKAKVETALQRALAYPHQTRAEAIERQGRGILDWNGTRVKRLGTIRVPTLVLAGADDILTPPAFSRALAKLIRRARLQVLPGGHAFFLENAEQFNRALVAFLKGVRAK